MTFIATPTTAALDEKEITSHEFWPAISLADFRDVMRLDGTVTSERLEHAVVSSVVSVNKELKAWRLTQTANGYSILESVPAEQINDKSELLHLYKRAVYCFAKANLLERYNDFDSTAKGTKDSEELNDTTDAFRRDGRLAIRDILGQNHVTVELI
ncbi:head completion/stabilization protein [Pseudoalteromonas luteoviolacea]|uniref:Head protein n=1 Tax=Pseudoalteromonas luteoviolacea NCIMB 1942 TaxID=1365253 RepID=A0A166Z6K5_9GAMM|nr:head completion/stabilization protein [Pseudoalteromonas luteoviolacea]KZN43990.1 head protein [Pseudoalteromonas luteoviolacea NCIMB 1942]